MISAPEFGRTDDSEKGLHQDEKSGKSFLDSIESLAIKQQNSSSHDLAVKNTELPDISVNDYPEVESSGRLAKKIDELNSIISSIENKPFKPAEIILDKPYRINYKNELNPAQLEAVT